MTYIKKNRETKTSMEIKRVYDNKTKVGDVDGDVAGDDYNYE